MNRFIELPEEEKRNVFQAVSGAMGLRSDIIEKDFWVCFMLNHLFHECKYKDAFVLGNCETRCASSTIMIRNKEGI